MISFKTALVCGGYGMAGRVYRGRACDGRAVFQAGRLRRDDRLACDELLAANFDECIGLQADVHRQALCLSIEDRKNVGTARARDDRGRRHEKRVRMMGDDGRYFDEHSAA